MLGAAVDHWLACCSLQLRHRLAPECPFSHMCPHPQQHIGAFEVMMPPPPQSSGGEADAGPSLITFLDTPGHAAFRLGGGKDGRGKGIEPVLMANKLPPFVCENL